MPAFVVIFTLGRSRRPASQPGVAAEKDPPCAGATRGSGAARELHRGQRLGADRRHQCGQYPWRSQPDHPHRPDNLTLRVNGHEQHFHGRWAERSTINNADTEAETLNGPTAKIDGTYTLIT
jgi:hypothetical protein